MNLYLLLLILFLYSSERIAIGGTIASLVGWIILAILLALFWKYVLYIFLFIVLTIVVIFIKAIIAEYLKYKDETTEEREERLKLNKMINDWRRSYYS